MWRSITKTLEMGYDTAATLRTPFSTTGFCQLASMPIGKLAGSAILLGHRWCRVSRPKCAPEGRQRHADRAGSQCRVRCRATAHDDDPWIDRDFEDLSDPAEHVVRPGELSTRRISAVPTATRL